ncbi:hypothetical protein LguiB_027159 [Lonicera macranthoides]
MPPRKKPPTASERQRKTNQYVRKKKGKVTPSHDPTLGASPSHGSTPKGTPTQDVTPVASPYTPGYSPSQTQTKRQIEEVVPAGPVYNAGEGSSSRAAPQEDDGGPVDKSVLATFNDHVAYAIWHRTLEEGNCKKLHTMCHWLKLKFWDLSKEVEGVQQRVRNSGLLPLIEHNYRCIDYVAVTAFIERWQPDINTFHLPFGEMTITLDDVISILGVSVVGSCFSGRWGGKEIGYKNAIELTKEGLGVSEAEVVNECDKAFSLRLGWIKEMCQGRATSTSTEVELDQCARPIFSTC